MSTKEEVTLNNREVDEKLLLKTVEEYAISQFRGFVSTLIPKIVSKYTSKKSSGDSPMDIRRCKEEIEERWEKNNSTILIIKHTYDEYHILHSYLKCDSKNNMIEEFHGSIVKLLRDKIFFSDGKKLREEIQSLMKGYSSEIVSGHIGIESIILSLASYPRLLARLNLSRKEMKELIKTIYITAICDVLSR